MNPYIRTVFAVAILVVYTACQKEVTNIVPTPRQPVDSTGIDTTGNNRPDSLYIISFSPDTGRAGTEVRILGSGFDSVATGNIVLINTTPAKIVSATKTTLTVQVAAGSTTGRIFVSARGKIASSAADFVVMKDSVGTDTTSGKNRWIRKTDPPPQIGATFIHGFSIAGKGYLFNGVTLLQYNPATNAWTQQAPLPSGTRHFYGFCFVAGGKAYAGLGANSVGDDITDTTNTQHNYKEVWEYDPVQDKWTQKADFPGRPRVVPFAFSIGNTGYMGGGDPGNANLDETFDFWRYNPATDSWSQLGDFPGSHSIGFTGLSIGNTGFVLEAGPGNPTAPVGATYSDKLWRYDAGLDKWVQTFLPIQNFVSAVAFTIGNKAYAAFGVVHDPANPPAEKSDFWEYDPALNTWAKKADVGGGLRWLGTGFAIGGKGYVGLGTGDTEDDQKNDFWEYTPE